MPRLFRSKRLKTISLTLLPQLNDLYHIDVKADNARPDTMLLPRISTILNNARRHLGKERVVLCVAGDFLAPSCLSKHFFGEHMVDVLNALETRFVSLGNHEFDIPVAQFIERINQSNFQWLCTNFRFGDEIENSDKVQPAGIVELAKEARLCLFGVLYPSRYKDFGIAVDPVSDVRALIGQFEGPDRGLNRLQSIVQYSRFMAERLAKGDFGHTGRAAYAALTHQDSEGDRRLADGVPQLFALLGGHEHEVLNRENLFACMIAKGLSNARTLRLNWFAAVAIADLEKIEGFGQDPQVLIDLAAEIYLDTIVPETQRLFIESLSTRTPAELDALRETVLSYFKSPEQSDSPHPNAGGLIDLLSGRNYFVRVVNRYFIFAYSLALHTQRPEFINVVPEDPRMRQLIDKWLQKSPEPSTPILLSPVEFELEDGTVRKRSTNFGNFAVDVVRGSRNRRNASRTQAQIGLLNSGGFRLDRNIDRGEPINRKLLCDIFYHNNKVRQFELSGKTIREILAITARLGGTDEGDGDFLQISGLRATIKGTTPGAIELLDPGGQWIALNNNDVYRVATTHYVSKISSAYSRFFQGRDELEVEPEIRLAVHDEFAALARCTDQERDAYFSDLSVSESRWNFA
jgi:2',3'-cyclic-nucleotide 2'-phosphodiesterase (5'-nucleotidase family)